MLSCVRLLATPWTVAHQAPLSMEFSRQEYWRRLLFPTRGDLPEPGSEATFLISPALAGQFFTTRPPGNPRVSVDSPVFHMEKRIEISMLADLGAVLNIQCGLNWLAISVPSSWTVWYGPYLPFYAISEVWCCVQRAGIGARLSWLISQLCYVLAVWPWESYLTPLCSQLPYHRLNGKVKKKKLKCVNCFEHGLVHQMPN